MHSPFWTLCHTQSTLEVVQSHWLHELTWTQWWSKGVVLLQAITHCNVMLPSFFLGRMRSLGGGHAGHLEQGSWAAH